MELNPTPEVANKKKPPVVAGYNDPGHPAGLPSEPSPRRLPAGDGSGATAQMEGLQGPGSLQPGFRQCCFPSLERKDARAGQETKKTKHTATKRAERENARIHSMFVVPCAMSSFCWCSSAGQGAACLSLSDCSRSCKSLSLPHPIPTSLMMCGQSPAGM